MTQPPPAYASQAALAGLASEVEGLRRALEHLRALPERVDDVAALVARLAGATAQHTKPAKPSTAPSWLDLPATAGPADAELLLIDLIGWLHTIYLRYTDAAKTFPGCWLWQSRAPTASGGRRTAGPSTPTAGRLPRWASGCWRNT